MADPVSIVVASYNYESFIAQTLQSILTQTLPAWEALVVDDGSTDNSREIIDRFCRLDGRFRLLQHEGGQNRGLAASLQLGIRHATGGWIAFCESDDWWNPMFLERLSGVAQSNPRSGLVFSDVILEGESASMASHCALVRDHFRSGGRAVDMYRRMQNAVPTMSCAMVRAELIRGCDFNARFAPSLDMWLWAQLVVRTEFSFVDQPLCHWRQHDASYMKKEVDPARLDMSTVLAFHDDIRALLRDGAAGGGIQPPFPERAIRTLRGRLRRLLRGR
jgi:glycosyltransferase involved in cell wall biosynthesis